MLVDVSGAIMCNYLKQGSEHPAPLNLINSCDSLILRKFSTVFTEWIDTEFYTSAHH